MGNGAQEKKNNNASWIIMLSLFIFIYNGYIFLNTNGNTYPLVSSLFNMLIALIVLFFIFNKEDIKRENKIITDN